MRMFAARYKKYAAWPVVLWCRLSGHRNQPRWDFSLRCLRCGDPSFTADEAHLDAVALNIVNQMWDTPVQWPAVRRKAHMQVLIIDALKAANSFPHRSTQSDRQAFERIIASCKYDGADTDSLTVGEIRRALPSAVTRPDGDSPVSALSAPDVSTPARRPRE